MKAASSSSLLNRFDRACLRSSAIFACVQDVALSLIPERFGGGIALALGLLLLCFVRGIKTIPDLPRCRVTRLSKRLEAVGDNPKTSPIASYML